MVQSILPGFAFSGWRCTSISPWDTGSRRYEMALSLADPGDSGCIEIEGQMIYNGLQWIIMDQERDRGRLVNGLFGSLTDSGL